MKNFYLGINSKKNTYYISYNSPFTGKKVSRGLGSCDKITKEQALDTCNQIVKLIDSINLEDIIKEKAEKLGLSEKIYTKLYDKNSTQNSNEINLDLISQLLELSKDIKYCDDTQLLQSLIKLSTLVITSCEYRLKGLELDNLLNDIELGTKI